MGGMLGVCLGVLGLLQLSLRGSEAEKFTCFSKRIQYLWRCWGFFEDKLRLFVLAGSKHDSDFHESEQLSLELVKIQEKLEM